MSGFDIERLLGTIDDDNLDAKRKVNYDESDLRELLTDGPIVKRSNPISAMEGITNDVDKGDYGLGIPRIPDREKIL